jgi:hypothetical protein
VTWRFGIGGVYELGAWRHVAGWGSGVAAFACDALAVWAQVLALVVPWWACSRGVGLAGACGASGQTVGGSGALGPAPR